MARRGASGRQDWASSAARLAGARPAALPAAPAPELAHPVEAPPAGPGWLHEIKYDGYRLLAILDSGRVRLLTRGGHDWTGRFPGLAAGLAGVPAETAVLDGEAAVVDADGRTDFSSLQRHLESGEGRVVYFAFDLLFLEGFDLTACALSDRRALLARLLSGLPPPVLLAGQTGGVGPEVLAAACRLGLEGIVSKRAASPYRSRRTRDWLKAKCGLRQEFVIGGLTRPKGGRTGFGALLLGVNDPRPAAPCATPAGWAQASTRRSCRRSPAGWQRSPGPRAPLPGRCRAVPRWRPGSRPSWWPRWPLPAGPRADSCARPPFSACARTSRPARWRARMHNQRREPRWART